MDIYFPQMGQGMKTYNEVPEQLLGVFKSKVTWEQPDQEQKFVFAKTPQPTLTEKWRICIEQGFTH